MANPSTPLPEQGGFNERLNAILDLLGERCIMQEHGLTNGSKQDEIGRSAAAIRTLVLEEIIGGDERPAIEASPLMKRLSPDTNRIDWRNQLRAEQRKKLGGTHGTQR